LRIGELCDPKRIPLDEYKRRWFKDFKVWEYPKVYTWLRKLGADNNKLKVMDFGCWACPFPEFLATEFNMEIWGVDNDDWKDLGKIGYEKIRSAYPNVNYFFDDVEKLPENNFDAIFSCSVLEHIPQNLQIEILNCLKSKLNKNGRMLHIVDFYFPEKHGKEGRRINFWDICKKMNYEVKTPNLCPGNPTFDFEKIRKEKLVNFLREWNQEARVVIGDDL